MKSNKQSTCYIMSQIMTLSAIFVFLTMASALTTLNAQEAAPSNTADSNNKLSIRTLCVGYQKEIRAVDLSNGKKERISIPMYDDAFSPPFSHSGALPIHISIPGAEKPFHSIKSIPNRSNLLILFVSSAKKSGKPYTVITLDDSDKDFRYGTRRMFNFCKSHIALRFGKKAISLPSGTGPKNVVIKESQVGEKRFAIEFYQKEKNKWKRFSATRWTLNPQKRSVIFFYTNPRTGRPTYRSVAEYYVNPALVQNKFEQNNKAAEDAGISKENIGKEEGPVAKPADENKNKTIPKAQPPT
jgi:hypothetical protein